MIKTLISVILFLIGIDCYATKYYVKSGGNDNLSGISDETAWANHPWMSTWSGNITLTPGDSICMRRGDFWAVANPTKPFIIIAQNGEEGNYITTTAYGTGLKPKIKISTNTMVPVIYGCGKSYIIMDNLDISHWDKSIFANGENAGIILGRDVLTSHDWFITNCDIHNCPSFGINVSTDAYNIVVGDTSAISTATYDSYSNHIFDCGYAGIGMSGCNPNTGISHFYVYYNYINDININGSDNENSYGIYFSSGVNSTNETKYCYARFNFIENIPNWEGIDCHNGQFLYFQDNHVKNCKFGICCQSIKKCESWAPVLNNLFIERNIIENSKEHLKSDYFFTHIFGGSSSIAQNIFILNNRYFYVTRPNNEEKSYGIKLSNTNGVQIAGNLFNNGPIGICQGAIILTPNTTNVKISNNFFNNWNYSISIHPSSYFREITINNNIIHTQYVAIIAEGPGEIAGNISLLNNSIIVSPLSTYSMPIRLFNTTIPNGSFLRVTNNLIGYTNTYAEGRYILTPSTIDGKMDINNNLYWNSTRTEPFYFLGPRSIEGWNKLGYDIHSIFNKDPLFRNPSGTYSQDIDFDIQSNSPAINKGTYVGLLTDYLGAPVNGQPDIGAFENQTGTYTPSLINSIIENWSTKTLEMNFNSLLNDKQIPDISSFIVNVNGSIISLNDVSVVSNKVLLSLSNAVVFGDNVTVSYNKPETNWVESNSGNPALAIVDQPVINNCRDPSLPNKRPTININFSSTVFSGFVYDLDASGSSDGDNDKLTFFWSAPQYVPVSSLTGPFIKFLTPVVTKSEILTFSLKVTDGIDTVSHNFEVSLLPFKPRLRLSKVRVIEASDYNLTNYPNNVADGDLSTLWSVDGDNHWLNVSLQEPYEISYIQIALLPDQMYEAYFDIYASKDNITWEPIILNAASCGFSGALQNFEFPAEKSEKDFLYVKLVGHGTSINSSNNYSEVKIFGQPSGSHISGDSNITLYPNPLTDNINILILEPPSESLILRVFDFGGRLYMETLLDPLVNNIHVPVDLPSGAYIVQILSRNLIIFSETIIVV